MAKKVIRLTEADIEKLVQKVIQEQKGDLVGDRQNKGNNILKSIKNFFKKRRNNSSFDWKGKLKGKLNFDAMGSDTVPAAQAVNVSPEDYTIRMHNFESKIGRDVTKTVDDITLDEFNIPGSSLPYADNMVKPYFDNYPEAQKVFDDIVSKFVTYIKYGGGPKLTNVTIKGSADSAKPTLDVPSGYSKLDHPDSKPYNGQTDPFKMNQYLADKRAEEYANALKSSIKEKVDFDLKIKILPGDNFYGQEGKRGEEYRKITLSPNAENLNISSTSPGTSTSKKNKSKEHLVGYYYNGKSGFVKGYKVIDEKGNKFMAISKENSEKWGTPTFKGQMSSQIKGGKFYIDGRLVGVIKPATSAPLQFTTQGRKFYYWVGPITNVLRTVDNEIEGEGKVFTTYLNEAYFLFY